MKGFEELEKLDPIEVYQRTYISVDEFNAIKNKNFEIFNRTKATGLMKILKREYDLDLDDWMEEYEAYKREHDDEKDIFVVAPKENDGNVENKLYIYIALGVIAFFVILFMIFPKNSGEVANETAASQNYIVDEAKETIEQQKEKGQEAEKLQIETPKPEEVEKVIPPVKKDTFYISSRGDLWIGIKYLDDNSQENKIFRDRLELDPARDQQLTLGHGHFTLVFNDQVVAPDVHNVHKITFKDGALNIKKVPLPKKKPEPTPEETEEPEETQPVQEDNVLEPIEE